VDGTNDSLVLVVFCGRFPVFAVTQVGYTATAVAVSSVIPVLVAFVALVAFPDKAPVKVVAVTEVSPARVVEDAPRAIAVVPTVTEEFVSPAFGMVATDPRTPPEVVVTYPAVVKGVVTVPENVGLDSVTPAKVVTVAPSDTAVDPIVTDEFVNPAFGIVATELISPEALVVTYPATVKFVSRFPVTVSVPVTVVFPVIPTVALVCPIAIGVAPVPTVAILRAPVVSPAPIAIDPVVIVGHSDGVAAAADAEIESMTGVVRVSPATVAAVPPRDTEVLPIVTEELVRPALGIVATDPRTPPEVVVTYPPVVREVVIVPVNVGAARVIPERLRAAEVLLRAIPVVPMNTVELPRTPLGIVPERFPAVV
jgi:hypothetical protein